MNPTLRGFLVVAAIALVIVVLQLYQTLAALFILVRIAFLLAIALFIFMVWREKRQSISLWSTRARYVFYGAALMIVAAILVWFVEGLDNYDALAFVAVVVVGGYGMWKTWRDQHTYS